MKKNIVVLIAIVIILGVLFIPIPSGVYKDGGTRTYSALTYKIVKWNKLIDKGGTYQKTAIYWLPANFKSLDELWVVEYK